MTCQEPFCLLSSSAAELSRNMRQSSLFIHSLPCFCYIEFYDLLNLVKSYEHIGLKIYEHEPTR